MYRNVSFRLVVDLDMIRQIWHETEKYREAATDGDIDYLQAVVDFFEPLKNYDVSAPCLADMFHFLWTTYKYAHTAQKARQCTDCNCTTAFRSDFTQYQWIFDGMLGCVTLHYANPYNNHQPFLGECLQEKESLNKEEAEIRLVLLRSDLLGPLIPLS